MSIDLSFCRQQFPALRQNISGYPVVFLDGPGGTQAPQAVIDAVSNYLAFENSNTHGVFRASRKTDERLDEARCAMADFLGCTPQEIAFGYNMTTLNYTLSRALARHIGKGDRIVITQLDHEANRGPWQALAETGAEVVECLVDLETCCLDIKDMKRKITPNTKIVALGYASNAVGTINDVKTVCRWAREAGAVSIVDAVHYAAHGPIDVRDIDCDFLVCSSYKFFGPHGGALYGKKEAFETLLPYKLLPQSAEAPYKIETGTLGHESIAGITPAIDFVASIGRRFPEFSSAVEPPSDGCCVPSRRKQVIAGMRAIEQYERELAQRLYVVLADTPGVRLYGLGPDGKRTPTFSFTMKGVAPRDLAGFLGDRGIFVWAGDFYATTLVRLLRGVDNDGLVRVGLAPYNTMEEIDRLEDALKEYASAL